MTFKIKIDAPDLTLDIDEEKVVREAVQAMRKAMRVKGLKHGENLSRGVGAAIAEAAEEIQRQEKRRGIIKAGA